MKNNLTFWQDYKRTIKRVWTNPYWYLFLLIALYPVYIAICDNNCPWYAYFYVLIVPVFLALAVWQHRVEKAHREIKVSNIAICPECKGTGYGIYGETADCPCAMCDPLGPGSSK